MSSITKRIKSYQEYIESHASDETRLLRCLEKLHTLDVRVQHLQDTGVGRTVNALRKEPGDVGASAKALVSKWKKMVAAEEESSEEEPDQKLTSDSHDDEDKQDYPDENRPQVTHDRNSKKQSSHSDHNSRKRHPEKKEENYDIRSEKSRYYPSSDSHHHDNEGFHNISDKTYHAKPIEVNESKIIKHPEIVVSYDGEKQSQMNDLLTIDNKIRTEQYKNSDSLKSTTSSDKTKYHSESSHHKSHKDKAKSQSNECSNRSSSSTNKNSDNYKKKSSDLISSNDKDKYSDSHKSSKESSKSDSLKISSEKLYKSTDKHKQKEHRSSKHESKGKDHTDEKTKSSTETNSSSKSYKSSHKNNTESNRKVSSHESSSSKLTSSTSSKSSSSSDAKSNSVRDKNVKPKKKQIEGELRAGSGDEGIGFGSGASFEEALGMASPLKKKKKNPVAKDSVSPVDRSEEVALKTHKDMIPISLLAPMVKLNPLPALEISALPDISPNYKPRPPPKLAALNQEEALTVVMSTKNQRTKVYSGNRVNGALPSLYEMCVMVLQQHIDALEYTGGVPYDILKPIVDKASPEQLFCLEHYNAHLTEDTNELWQKHCRNRFRNKQRLELESWREMFMRCQEEQEAKLKSLTANIKLSQEVKMAPTRQTKMAYVDDIVKPPRGVARKQAIHGTARLPVVSPAARVAALAGNNVVRASIARAPLPSSPQASTHKIKKAPLMQKALQLMRSGRGGKR